MRTRSRVCRLINNISDDLDLKKRVSYQKKQGIDACRIMDITDYGIYLRIKPISYSIRIRIRICKVNKKCIMLPIIVFFPLAKF